MRNIRLHVEQLLGAGTTVTADRELAHYALTVLRLRSGASCTVFNSRDGEFAATLESSGRHQLALHLGQSLPCAANPRLLIHLGLGVSRGERMDYAIQKCTELGVTAVTPLLTERCEVRLSTERLENRRQHWQKIAINSCEQCGRTLVPEIHLPVSLDQWLAAQRGGIVLDPMGNVSIGELAAEDTARVLIGPEGGWSDEETARALAAGYRRLRLGPRILRTETAPVAVLSILQGRFGDLKD